MAAAVKYDVSDVEAGGGGEEPEPNLYKGKIAGITHRKKNKSGATSDLEVVLDIGSEYVRLWYYVILPDAPHWNKDQHGWKLREFLDAVGLPPKGALPTPITKLNGKEVNVKVIADTNQDGDYRGKAKSIYLPTEGKATKASAAASDEPDNEGGSDEGPYGREEIESWTDDDRAEYAAELGVEIPTGRGAAKKLIDALVEAEEGGGEPEPEPEGDGDGGSNPALEGVDQEFLDELNADPEAYAEWTDEDIKWLVEGLGIDGNVPTSGRGWKAKAIAAFVELAGEGGAAAADEDTYDDEDEWPLAKLKEEVATRQEAGSEIEVSGRATRQKLIDALREDDKNGNPF